jgi:hypothetical protein
MPASVDVSAFTKRRYMAFPSPRPRIYLQIDKVKICYSHGKNLSTNCETIKPMEWAVRTLSKGFFNYIQYMQGENYKINISHVSNLVQNSKFRYQYHAKAEI